MTKSPKTQSLLPLRVFRVLLRVYPEPFRTQYRAELERFFSDDLAEARRSGGVLWRARFWLRTAADAARASLRLHSSGGRVDSSRGRGSEGVLPFTDDVRHALRTVVRDWRFSFAAITVLALGIGATLACFAIVDHVLLRPLPYPNSDRLAQVGMSFRVAPEMVGPLSLGDLAAIEDEVTSLEVIAAAAGGSVVVGTPGGAARLDAARTTNGYLDLLGARAAMGRVFVPADHAPDAARVVVLTHALWRDRFGGDPRVLGRTLILDGEPSEIIGILRPDLPLPRGFTGEAAQLWIPMSDPEGPPRPGAFILNGIGRLKAGVTIEQLRAEVNQLVARRYPVGSRPSPVLGGAVAPLRDRMLGNSRLPLVLALAGVSLLLLLTCVNLAALLLARGVGRRTELAVRSALGARPRRVLTQLFAESLTLALVGGAAGIGVAFLALTAFKRLSPDNLPRLPEVSIDARIVVAAFVVSLLTGALFGLIPAWRQASRLEASQALRRTGGGAADRSRLRSVLIAGEVGLAVVFALASGLMANSYVRLASVDPGFRPDGLIALQVELSREYDSWEVVRSIYAELLERVRAIPGVTSAAFTTRVPFESDGARVRYVPQDLPPEEEGVFLPRVVVDDGYFRMMGVPIVEGRAFGAGDGPGSVAALVNQTFVRTYWPDASSVLGRTIKQGTREGEGPTYVVVGVVGDILQDPALPPEPQIYLSFRRENLAGQALVVRTGENPDEVVRTLRDLVRRMDSIGPVTRLATLRDMESALLVAPRFYAVLIGGFGTLALLIALIGVYGATAYQTRGRAREIGIRLALGAECGRVVRQIVVSASIASLVGVAAGVLVGMAATRVLARFLFDLEPTDPATFVAVALSVAGAAVLAAYLPARRAAAVDPGHTLRAEG